MQFVDEGISAMGAVASEYELRCGELPEEVLCLAPRMQQVASVIYFNGGASAKEIRAALDVDITVNAIRTLLNRLLKRGIIRRRWSGRHREILYFPGINTPRAREVALNRLLTDYFRGSLDLAVQKLSGMCFASTEPPRNPFDSLGEQRD